MDDTGRPQGRIQVREHLKREHAAPPQYGLHTLYTAPSTSPVVDHTPTLDTTPFLALRNDGPGHGSSLAFSKMQLVIFFSSRCCIAYRKANTTVLCI